ncbi:pantothenate kinase [Halteromyces radiatus]|uniref:pantothenate kinase n=1 Tax=Halteromyces radiatus TaxID=101107 RepID=UPI00221ED3B4|nr:pantothenate kinase [Halteromyces radiatus]KAI8080010.1 pantothenate kinase [Halteromyces radiatus]
MNVLGASVSEAITDPVHETRDILLPNQTEHVAQIAVDIGGSLAKIVYFTAFKGRTGGRLHFKKFETEKIDECIEFIAELVKDAQEGYEHRRPMVLKATGGGAHLYYDKLKSKLPGVHVQKEDEMECLITGLNFFITEIPYEAFTYDEQESDPMQFETNPSPHVYPYILVNIGSGVSVLKVTGPDEFSRISGTSLGGGTLWGLMSLLTKAETFDEMLEMSVTGDNRHVDLLVGDIYGSDYTKLGLKASRIASSFGKVFKKGKQPTDRQFNSPDIAKSLLYMVSNNIGQIAYLNARQHDIKRIYFGGCFIRGHPITMNTLSYAIKFWSNGTMKALFLRHEGHLGATGAFLKYSPIRKARHSFSFSENFTPDTSSHNPSRVYGDIEDTNVELLSQQQIEDDMIADAEN